MDNEAIARARGDFVLWCDSDDVLEPQAVDRLLSTWRSIAEAERSEFVGVTALAATQEGVIVNPFPDVDHIDVSWNDLAEVHHVSSDMIYMVRSEEMRGNPFPEVDLVIPEGVVWNAIGYRKTRSETRFCFASNIARRMQSRLAAACPTTGAARTQQRSRNVHSGDIGAIGEPERRGL